jgi:hypothetical protein
MTKEAANAADFQLAWLLLGVWLGSDITLESHRKGSRRREVNLL